MEAVPTLDEQSRVPDLTPDVFWRVMHALPDYLRPPYVTIAATGLRVGEYLALTRDHLMPATCSIRVPGTKTAGSADTVRVDERAVPSPVRYKWLRLHWKRALASAKAETGLRLHDLRHCTGQWLVDAGRPEASVQRTLRHETASMTRRYTMQKDRGEDAKVMADVLLELRKGA
jgi:integrase